MAEWWEEENWLDSWNTGIDVDLGSVPDYTTTDQWGSPNYDFDLMTFPTWDYSNDFWTYDPSQEGSYIDIAVDDMLDWDDSQWAAFDALDISGGTAQDFDDLFGGAFEGTDWELGTVADGEMDTFMDSFWDWAGVPVEDNGSMGASGGLAALLSMIKAGGGGASDMLKAILGGSGGSSALKALLGGGGQTQTQNAGVLGDGAAGLLGLAGVLANLFGDKDPAMTIMDYQYPEWAKNAMQQKLYELSQTQTTRDDYEGADQIPWPFPYVDEYEDRLTDMTDFSTGDRSVWDVIQNGNMNDYMSAYTDAVLQPVLKDMDDRYALDMNEINRKAGMMNAYGTERDRLYKDELTDTYMENRDQTIANAYDSAWKDATGLAGADTERRYAAMSALPALYNALGDDRLDWEKFIVEFPYEIFNDKWDFNPTMTNAVASAMRNMIPTSIDYTQTNIPAEGNPWGALFSEIARAGTTGDSWLASLFNSIGLGNTDETDTPTNGDLV